ncbi:hypothetical protein GUITHDRAFT_100181 [Guillardia theta CCMP2712]|uniref:Uncharacterized protein n=1 Tax=Guillardia theta (strain CCMP2712) TaxID=905079 RepID=L1JZC1_GUITC|nr:hypothetical protein GUITHDRAFT_100181 [Guillardia theta CCMP2712]EKX53931.1 hypothetical protein GUITHDRAFT_100181 [Guillardia theta CCMP2712]|eukprot:XP_005840911.1 hypothetical protein GUITHDRAFT_100181 [Guillardia theta CCMP2712]
MAQTRSKDVGRPKNLLSMSKQNVSCPVMKAQDSTSLLMSAGTHKAKSFAGRSNHFKTRLSARDLEFACETEDDRDLEKFVLKSGVDLGLEIERAGSNFNRDIELRARLGRERMKMKWKALAKGLILSQAVCNAREQMKITMLGSVHADFSRITSSASNYYSAEVFSGLFDDNLVIFEPPTISFLRREEFRGCLDSLEKKKQQEYLELLHLHKTANRAVLAEDEDGELENGAFVDLGRRTPQLAGEEEGRRAPGGVFFERRPSTGETVALVPS